MSRYIRYKYQKQQINFMNCCDIDDWIDTNNKRITGFDSVYGDAPEKKNLELNDEWEEVYRFQDETYTCYEPILKEEVVNTIYRIRWRFNYSPTYEDFRFNIPLNSEDYFVIGVSDQDLSTYTIENRDSFEVDRIISGNSIDLELRHTFSPVDEHFVDILYCKVNNNTEKGYLGIQTSYYGSSSCKCVEVWENEPEVMTRTKKLNPNYEYECIDGNRHYRLQVQESYDKGASWVDTQRFELGDVYEENSEWCNATEIKFKWEYYNEIIKGFEKIINWIKKFSLDGGETWDYLTYIDDNGEVIYEYKQTAMNIDGCGRHSDIEYQIKAAKTTIGACDTSAQPSVMARYRTGKLCCIERNIIWGDWGDWYNLKKGTDYTITMDEIEKNETDFKKVYNYSVQGLGVYGSLSASSTITQMEGPCTPPEEPDIPTPDPEPEPDVPTPDPEPGMDEYFLWCKYNTAYTESTLNVSDDFELNISTNNKPYVFTDYPEIKTKFYVPQKDFYSGNTNVQFDSTITHLYKFETTKKMTSLKYMFRDAGWLEEINCKDWDVSNVTDLTGAFGVTSPRNTCRLKKLDLSGWDTSNVERTTNMIKAYGLEELNLCNWDVSKMTSPSYNRFPIMVYDNCKIYINKDYAFWYEKLKESGWSDETVRKMLIML